MQPDASPEQYYCELRETALREFGDDFRNVLEPMKSHLLNLFDEWQLINHRGTDAGDGISVDKDESKPADEIREPDEANLPLQENQHEPAQCEEDGIGDARQSFGRGRGGIGLGKAGVKRHRKVLRDSVQGISKGSIRHLARRGGVKRLSGLIYEETRGALKVFLENVIHDAYRYTESAKRKTITNMDIEYALKRQGRTLYTFRK